jgi:4-diphosphocytidyl-2-C-methyl-D-erythritol kinase
VTMAAPRMGEPASITLRAPAKVNLALEIVGRRPDGQHDLRTIMQAVDLEDEVEITWDRAGEGLALVLTADRAWKVPDGPENLAWKAADAFAAALSEPAWMAAGERPRIVIRLRKRIPVGSGLGGGSADAAAVLLGMNLLRGRPLGAGVLYRLAASLGADVPFALAGGTCFATGRGERLRRLPGLESVALVLVAPQVPVATAWAYSAWDAEPLTGARGSASILESAIRHESLSRVADALWNDLEAVVERRYGVVKKIREDLLAAGALGARMSGSGSAVFGLVGSHGDALHVAAALRSFEHPVIVCRPLPAGCRPSNA